MPLNTTPAYPAALDSLPDPASGTNRDADGYEHSRLHTKINAIVEALETKLGISGGAGPTSAGVLRWNGAAGASTWGPIQNVDINPTSILPGSLYGGGTANRILRTDTGAAALWGLVNTTELNGTIAGTQIAAGAPGTLLGGVSAASVAIASPTLANITGATVTWTSNNRPVLALAILTAAAQTVSNGTLAVVVYEGASPWATIISDSMVIGSPQTKVGAFYQATPGGGARTYYLKWSASAGTCTASLVTFVILELR